MKLQKFNQSIIFYSGYHSEESKINCVSRRDDRGKNLFVEKSDKKVRWNLYSQIAIENDMLVCAKKEYKLTDICRDDINPILCTLLDTNEVVDIGYDFYS